MGGYITDWHVDLPVKKDEWVMYNLVRQYGNIARQGGVDIDGDGKKEVFGDFDGKNGIGNLADYVAFYQQYKRKIQKAMPIFRGAAWFDKVVGGSGLPLIHNILSISALRLRAEHLTAYIDRSCLAKVMNKVYGESYDVGMRGDIPFLNYLTFSCLYLKVKDVLKSLTSTEQKVTKLVNMVGPDYVIVRRGEKAKCSPYLDEAIIAAVMLAKQLGVKDVDAVLAPRDRLFLSYKKGDATLYLDSKGRRFTHAELQSEITKDVAKGVYLRPLSDKELIGSIALNRAFEWYKLGHFPFMLKDLGRSTYLFPKSPNAWTSRASLYHMLAKDPKRARSHGILVDKNTQQLAWDFGKKAFELDKGYARTLKCPIIIHKPEPKSEKEEGLPWTDYAFYAAAGLVMATLLWRLIRGKWGFGGGDDDGSASGSGGSRSKGKERKRGSRGVSRFSGLSASTVDSGLVTSAVRYSGTTTHSFLARIGVGIRPALARQIGR